MADELDNSVLGDYADQKAGYHITPGTRESYRRGGARQKLGTIEQVTLPRNKWPGLGRRAMAILKDYVAELAMERESETDELSKELLTFAVELAVMRMRLPT